MERRSHGLPSVVIVVAIDRLLASVLIARAVASAPIPVAARTVDFFILLVFELEVGKEA